MIRKATLKDLDAVEAGYLAHFAYEKEHGAYTVFKEGVYPTRNDAEIAIESYSLFVFEENDIVVGSIIFNKKQPEEYNKIGWLCRATPDEVMVIHLVMVHPGMAGKGIGSALVNHVLALAKANSCTAVRLDTGEQNSPAVSLYKKLGFALVESSSMKVGGAIFHNKHLFFEKNVQ